MGQIRAFAGVASIAMIAMSAAMGWQNFQSNPTLQRDVLNDIPGFANPITVAVAQPVAPKLIRVASLATTLPLPAPPSQAPAPAQAVLPAPITTAAPVTAPAPLPAPVQPPAPQVDDSALQADAVAQRVKESVPPELFSYFHTYLYVSKAAHGAWAQHMFVFHRADSGRMIFVDSFPVSTGREQHEKYFTSTPTGIFELDPNRFDEHHRSHRWGGAPMPWAMFLNYTIHGHLAGIALHSGVGHVAFLGQRASGGCVRMPPEKAEYYFKKFRAEEYGQVPVFAFDGDTTAKDGRLVRDAAGNPEMTEGYRVLLIIQDYPGGPALVAMVS
jgi:lipoprotein-anchoring transpeptidase ErfK/SrfK